jgi:membrane protein
MGLGAGWRLCRRVVNAWVEDNASSMGAALAYYTVFAVAPLLTIAIVVAGLVFGEEAARGEIVAQIRDLIGSEGAQAVQALLRSASKPSTDVFAAAVSVCTLVVGATTVFGELQRDLDIIWRVPARRGESGLWRMVWVRLLSFGLVLGLGFLMLVSLIVSAAIAAFGRWSGDVFGWEPFLHGSNFLLSFGVIALLFAMIYKFMPRTHVAWRDVWVGAAVTALLFEVGKFLIGLYLGKTGVASGFGALGSLIVLLIWVYYSAQIFLLGAEFTRVYSLQYGSQADPAKAARPRIRRGPGRRRGDLGGGHALAP